MRFEEILAGLREVWEEVLEREVTDFDADFFDLGGDSLLALLVANQAVTSGIPIPPGAVFQRRSLRALAEAVVDPSLFEDRLTP